MKKTLLVAAVALSALFAGSAMAADGPSLSYNIGVTNNYVWRGVSQTMDNSALQGGVDYKNGTFYAGAWASNVDFGPQTASTEVDLYLGIAPTVGDWSFDFGAIYYAYPNECAACDFNVGELKAAVNHTLGKGTIGAAMYLPMEELEDPYYEVNASYPITDKWAVSGAIGNYESLGYRTWNIGASYALTSSLSLDLRYSEASKLPSNLYATIKATF